MNASRGERFGVLRMLARHALLLLSLWSGLGHAAAFVYGPIAEPIVAATFSADVAGLTAHRFVAGVEVNTVRLVAGADELDLSDLLFGTSDVLFDAALIDQGDLGTGVVAASVDASFFPALAGGAVGLLATLTDTFDGLFAIDFFSLTITTGSGSKTTYVDTDDGFGIGLANGASLPAALPDSIPFEATGTGFDETVSSVSFQPAPTPGTLWLVVAGMTVLWVARRCTPARSGAGRNAFIPSPTPARARTSLHRSAFRCRVMEPAIHSQIRGACTALRTEPMDAKVAEGDTSMPRKTHNPRYGRLAAVALLAPAMAQAIPTFPDPAHDNPVTVDRATTWLTNPAEVVRDPDPDNPGRMQHQHRDRHRLDGKLIVGSGGDVTNTVTTDDRGTPGNANDDLGFGTYAVWDNRNWRFDRANGRSLDEYAHGFIFPGPFTAVRYSFDDAFDDDGNPATPPVNRWFTDPTAISMRNSIDSSFVSWETAVSGMQLNVNGIPVVRSVDFMSVGANAARPCMQPGANSDIAVCLGGGPEFDPVATTLSFPLRTDYDFNDLPGGVTPADANGNGIDDQSFDFSFLALHEIGHILGLGHFGTDDTINLENAAAARHDVNGSVIDAGSQDGARDLYTIAVPRSLRLPARAFIGSRANPQVTFDGATGLLQFEPAVINFADLSGGHSQQINPAYANDPLIGATIAVSDLLFEGLAPSGLYQFSGGNLTIAKDGQTLLDAAFDLYFLDSTAEDNEDFVDSFTILLRPLINDAVQSALLNSLSSTAYGGSGAFLDFFFQTPGADLVSATSGFTTTASLDATYFVGPNGFFVPESSTALLVGLAYLGLCLARSRLGGR